VQTGSSHLPSDEIINDEEFSSLSKTHPRFSN